MPFVQALTALEFRPVLLSGTSDVKVVDVAIQRTLDALTERGHGDVLLASHDGDFVPHLVPLLEGGHRRGGLIGFPGVTSGGGLQAAGARPPPFGPPGDGRGPPPPPPP